MQLRKLADAEEEFEATAELEQVATPMEMPMEMPMIKERETKNKTHSLTK